MKFICLFCTSFISLGIYMKYFMKKKKVDNADLICYYFLSVLSNNFLMNILLYFVFKRNELTYTVQFTEKYIILSTIIAIHLPIIYNMLSKNIDNILKSYFEFITKSLTNIKKKIFKSKIYHNIVNYYKKNKEIIKKNCLFIFLIMAQFLFFDIVIRTVIYNEIGFYSAYELTPNILTIAYGLFIGTLLTLFPKKISKVATIITYIFNLILFIVNYMLILIKSKAFTVYDLQIAGEGFEYINFISEKISIKLILIILLSILLLAFTLSKLKKVKCDLCVKQKAIVIVMAVVTFFIIRFIGVGILEDYKTESDWEDISYPKYYTENLINSRKNVSVLGIYEYTLKDIIKYYKDMTQVYGSKEEIEEIISDSDIETKDNDMTGKFEGKNLIMIMMESIDNVIVDEETMPTLSKMMNEGWNFKKRYSQLNNGGSTIATEYATISGLYHIGNNKYDVNSYNESIPSIFSKNNYTTASFHENNGVYYNRSELHKSLGFEKSYFLYDMNLEELLYYEDSQFFDNDKLYDLVVPKNSDKPFMSFITTISAHGPYVNNGYCNDKNITDENECLRYLSKKTDNMLASMLKRLEKDNLLDDTVIILYSDHSAYSYNYTEEELSNTYKQIDEDYNIKNLPFVIYSKDIESKEYDDIIVNDVDFVPTILNLFNIDYDANYYVGTDIFSENHKNICIFNDYSWYDGKIYSVNSKKDSYYKETSDYVKEKLDFNRMLITNNYYREIKKT